MGRPSALAAKLPREKKIASEIFSRPKPLIDLVAVQKREAGT
jgi:hypothetical protein